MAIPFALPTEDDVEIQGQQLEQLLLDLHVALQQVLRTRNIQHTARNPRLPRRAVDALGQRDHPVILVHPDLTRLPLPDLVLSAVEQLPPPTPQVTVSAPSSPTRDVAFQFPECSTDLDSTVSLPTPSPRPRPRRRRFISEMGTSTMKKGPPEPVCDGSCCGHAGQRQNIDQWVSVGANLRNIADDFHVSKTKDTSIEKSRLPVMSSGFSGFSGSGNANNTSESLLSLLIPAPLRETLWTTVALYLGWRLVSRLR